MARWLARQGHEIFSVYEEARGMTDDAVIAKAYVENRILVTSDKDFGLRIYRDEHPHHGVVLLRLANERAAVKITVMKNLIEKHSDRLLDHYVVVTEERVRFAKS